MNLFTVQLVNSIKFPDLIRVVAVVLYVEWIFNENNFSLFENNLVYQSNTLTLFTSSNFEIHFCKDMKPKELEFFAQNTSCVLLPLRFENWADQQRVKAKKPAKTMILYKSIVKWTSASRLAHLLSGFTLRKMRYPVWLQISDYVSLVFCCMPYMACNYHIA